jgi:hypothetical protein
MALGQLSSPAAERRFRQAAMFAEGVETLAAGGKLFGKVTPELVASRIPPHSAAGNLPDGYTILSKQVPKS